MSYKGLRNLLKERGFETSLALLDRIEKGELNAVFKGKEGFTGDRSLDEQIEAFLVEKGASILDCDIDVDERPEKM